VFNITAEKIYNFPGINRYSDEQLDELIKVAELEIKKGLKLKPYF